MINQSLNPDELLLIEKDLAEKSLLEFAALSFHFLEPSSRKFVRGWSLGAICEHLEAVTRKEITKLLINVPPGCMKSMMTRVFWPAWEWGPQNLPATRSIGASYADSLALRDNLRMRRLVNSPWYRSLWGDRFRITDDQNAKVKFENDKTGWMLATSVRGVGTGERGDRFVIDDPHNVKQGESKAIREETIMWFSEVVPTRLNDDDSAQVVIMQRVHEEDVSGYILAQGLGFEHLCLPMRYEKQFCTSTRFTDPRRNEGELLWPQRFGPAKVKDLEKTLGTYAAAGQLQQQPVPRSGGLFKRDNFVIVDSIPGRVVKSVRYWDKAGSDGSGAYTAGVRIDRLNVNGDIYYLVRDVIRGQWSSGKREARMKLVAEADGKAVKVWIEQEPGSGGKDSVRASVANLDGFSAFADRVTGDKETRADPYAAQVEIGRVLILRGPWNAEFIDEHVKFPRGKYKDQVDAASGAYTKCSRQIETPDDSISGMVAVR